MKSLEIIDRKTMLYGDVILNTEEAEQIKQDLEVLEIIRKKSVYLRELKHILRGFREKIYTTMEEVLVGYNLYVTRENELTMEELLKLKQWLEKEEN